MRSKRNDDEHADREQLLTALRHQRLAAEAERQAHRGRGFFINLSFGNDGTPTVSIAVGTPVGDERLELALARAAGDAAVKALTEAAKRMKELDAEGEGE